MTSRDGLRLLSWSGWRDPRVPQVAILGMFTILGQTVLHFDVTLLQIAAAVLSVAIADIGVTYARTGAVIFPTSALISGLSLGLLLRAPAIWPFVLAGLVTVVGKHGVRVAGRHVFNPSNLESL